MVPGQGQGCTGKLRAVKDSKAAAQNGIAGPVRIPGETEARRKIVAVWLVEPGPTRVYGATVLLGLAIRVGMEKFPIGSPWSTELYS